MDDRGKGDSPALAADNDPDVVLVAAQADDSTVGTNVDNTSDHGEAEITADGNKVTNINILIAQSPNPAY